MRDASILPLLLADVTVSFDGLARLDGVSLTLADGPRTVILGPNGAGKSLLLRLCHGLLRPDSGSVDWLGSQSRDHARHQAMVFQRPVMLRRSAAANVEYALSLHGVPRALRRRRAAEALERVGLAGHARNRARVLSGGEQQRLALARAWVLEPDILFLDEPTASLDPASVCAVEDIIQAIHRNGCKIVMTTHDLGQARRLADEVIFLHRGRLIERTAASAFFERPRSPEARTFVAGELLW